MGIRKLGGVPYVYQWHHLFLTAWNQGGTGAMPTFSAFPSNEGGSPGIGALIGGLSTSDSSKEVEENHTPDPDDADDFGHIKPSFIPDYYTPGGEWAPGNRFVTLRETRNNLTPRLSVEAAKIGAKQIKYVATGPNSNSYAMSLAERVGLPRRKPAGDAPGSGMRI